MKNIIFSFILKLPTATESITPLRLRHPEPGSVPLVVSCRGGFVADTGGAFYFLLALMASSSGPGRTGPGLRSSVLLLLVLVLTELSGPVVAVSEPGKWILNIDSVSFDSVAATWHTWGSLVSLNISERKIKKLQTCFTVVYCGLLWFMFSGPTEPASNSAAGPHTALRQYVS